MRRRSPKHADAGVGERGGGFHGEEVARYSGSDRTPQRWAGWTTSPRQSSRPGAAPGEEHGARLARLLEVEQQPRAAELALPRSGYGALSPSRSPRPRRRAARCGSRRARTARGRRRRRRARLAAHRGSGRCGTFVVEAAGSIAVTAGEHGAPCCSRSPATSPPTPSWRRWPRRARPGHRPPRARAVALPAHVWRAATCASPSARPTRSSCRARRRARRPPGRRGFYCPSTRTPSSPSSRRKAPPRAPVARPHDDPDPARRVARRILQRLHGMGKWGGYHTDFAHLSRGFAGNDRGLADRRRGAAGHGPGREAERRPAPRLPQPRRKAAIHALMERGEVPDDLRLPWQADRP